MRRRRGALRKALLDAPAWLFRGRFGFIFGHRFICIEHEGRLSGTVYKTTVEVVYRDRASNEHYAVAARGRRAEWYRNISKYPATAVYIGRRRHGVEQRMVPIDEAVAVMKIYQQRHPKAAAALLGLSGVGASRSTEPWAAAMERLPVVAFKPR